MIFSQEIKNISAALVQAQAQAKGAIKDGKNTFFKTSKGEGAAYATLDSVIDAVKESLTKAELAVIQAPTDIDSKPYVITRLQHKSGEFIEIKTPLFMGQQTMQAFGSAITYAKRYALTSLLNISTDGDDDGNAASQRVEPASKVLAEAKKDLKNPYVFDGGVYIGKKFSEVSLNDLQKELDKYKTAVNPSKALLNLIERLEKYLKEETA